MDRAVRFYRDTLGMTVTFTNGDPTGLVIVRRDEAELHLTLVTGHRPGIHNVAHMMVTDAAGLHEHLTSNGVRIIKRLRDAEATTGLPGGRATLTTSRLAVGSHTLTAVYSGDTANAGSTSAPVTQVVNAPAPASVAPTSGGGQSTQPGTAFGQPLVATVTDTSGNPSANQPVTFTVTAGSASFPGGASAQATTGADGRATSATLTAGTTPGPVTVTATTGGLSTSYNLTVQAAPAAITVRGGGSFTTGGKNYSIAVDVQATAAGQASGKFSLSGGGADTTAGSRTITSVTKTSTGSTVTGTASTSSGKTVTFTLTVVDKPGGKDQVTVELGSTTVSGTLNNGNITTS